MTKTMDQIEAEYDRLRDLVEQGKLTPEEAAALHKAFIEGIQEEAAR